MKTDWKSVLRVGIIILILYTLIHYQNALLNLAGCICAAAKPLLLGLAFAYVINILMSFYEKQYTRLFRRTGNLNNIQKNYHNNQSGNQNEYHNNNQSENQNVQQTVSQSENQNVHQKVNQNEHQKVNRNKNQSENQKENPLRRKRPICLALALVSIALILLILCRMILPELFRCLTVFLEKLPESLDAAVVWLQEHWAWGSAILEKSGYITDGTVDWSSLVSECTAYFFGDGFWSMDSVMDGLFALVGGMITLVLAVVFAIYLLLRKERLITDVRYMLELFLKKRTLAMTLYIFRALNDAFHHYIVGQCLEAAVLGTLCIAGMLIFGFPYATMIGSLVGFTALIPLAGAYIGAAVGAIMIFTVSPLRAALFLIFLAVLQQLENNLIYPRIVGASIGLPGIWVLAAVVIGAGVGGIPGLMLAVPLTAAAYSIFREIFWGTSGENDG